MSFNQAPAGTRSITDSRIRDSRDAVKEGLNEPKGLILVGPGPEFIPLEDGPGKFFPLTDVAFALGRVETTPTSVDWIVQEGTPTALLPFAANAAKKQAGYDPELPVLVLADARQAPKKIAKGEAAHPLMEQYPDLSLASGGLLTTFIKEDGTQVMPLNRRSPGADLNKNQLQEPSGMSKESVFKTCMREGNEEMALVWITNDKAYLLRLELDGEAGMDAEQKAACINLIKNDDRLGPQIGDRDVEVVTVQVDYHEPHAPLYQDFRTVLRDKDGVDTVIEDKKMMLFWEADNNTIAAKVSVALHEEFLRLEFGAGQLFACDAENLSDMVDGKRVPIVRQTPFISLADLQMLIATELEPDKKPMTDVLKEMVGRITGEVAPHLMLPAAPTRPGAKAAAPAGPSA